MPHAGPAHPATATPRAQPARAWASALAVGCLLLASPPALTQGAPTRSARPEVPTATGKTAKTAKTAAAARKSRAASLRQTLSDQAKGLALASATTEAISAGQLDIATRVLTGQADCELKQTVRVLALPGKPGLFTVDHQGKRFVMAPRETSTGAVRLEDPAAGVVWLQIPAKSMLMNTRIGQRMVDSCLHAEQRGGLLAVAGPQQSLGIEVTATALASALPTPAPPAVPAMPPAASETAAASAAPAASAAAADPAVAMPQADAASAPATPAGCSPAAAAPAQALPPLAPASAPVAEAAAAPAAPAASR